MVPPLAGGREINPRAVDTTAAARVNTARAQGDDLAVRDSAGRVCGRTGQLRGVFLVANGNDLHATG